MLIVIFLYSAIVANSASQAINLSDAPSRTTRDVVQVAVLLDNGPIKTPQLLLSQPDSQTGSRPQAYRLDSLVDVLPPGHNLVLLQEAEVPIVLHQQGLTQVGTVQVHVKGQENLSDSDNIPGSDRVVPVLFHPNGSAYIDIVPMRLGKVELFVDGRFPDGGLFYKHIALDVEPSERQVDGITVGDGVRPLGPIPVVLMSMENRNRNRLLVHARYGGTEGTIQIDAPFVQFQVRRAGNSQVIEFNKTTGVLQAVNPGFALVESSFGGKKALTCVVVTQKEGDWHDQKGCDKLLAPEEDLPNLPRRR